LQSQEVTGRACIGLEQNIIDTAVKWIKKASPLPVFAYVGQHFKQFYCRQLKNGQLN